MDAKGKREKIKKLVLDVVTALDNDKQNNVKYYTALLNSMSDQEFAKWAGSMGYELDDTIQMFQLPFEEMKMNQIKKAADILKIPLDEYIWYRHTDSRGIRTSHKVPVGYVHVKRVQQFLAKKNKYTFDNEERTLKTGQVTGDSKVTRVSDDEAFSLMTIGAEKALKEFLGPRADNQAAKNSMYRKISQDGFATLEDMDQDITKQTTLNTIDTYMLASGIKTDMITPSLKTATTIKNDLSNRKQN